MQLYTVLKTPCLPAGPGVAAASGWLPWALCALLALALAAAALRLWLLHRGLDELGRQLSARLETDTNNPLFLSTRDPHARRLAARLNRELLRLRKARLRYERGDRALKEAVANLAHDLRTPLAAICGYLELLEQQPGCSEGDAARYLAILRERADAMTGMTGELLRYAVTLSAGEELCPEPVCLNAALEEALAAAYPLLTEKGIEPKIEMPEEKVVRQLDRQALGRIFGNLLQNAARHGGGDLHIVMRPDGSVTFSNTAPGLGRVQAGQLFGRYFSVDSAGETPSGLGLPIAKALAEKMGGRLTAEYKSGGREKPGRLSIRAEFPSQGSNLH